MAAVPATARVHAGTAINSRGLFEILQADFEWRWCPAEWFTGERRLAIDG
jgi:hypothetical protein